jgi:hypothetical protein
MNGDRNLLRAASATTPLIAPANVDAVALSSTSVEVVWDNESSSESGFLVQPYSNGNAIGSPASVAAGTTDYVFTSAAASARAIKQLGRGVGGPIRCRTLATESDGRLLHVKIDSRSALWRSVAYEDVIVVTPLRGSRT